MILMGNNLQLNFHNFLYKREMVGGIVAAWVKMGKRLKISNFEGIKSNEIKKYL